MKIILFFIVSLLIAAGSNLSAQDKHDDYNFQQTYKEIQKLLDKDTKSLSADEVDKLKSFANLDENEYGVKYQSNLRNIKTQIAVKIREFDNLQREQEYSRAKETELGEVQRDYEVAQDTIAAVKQENTVLIKTIADLNIRIKKLDNERKKLVKANKDLENANKETGKLLEQSRRTMRNIIGLIGTSQIREGQMDIPKEQIDSLQQAECSVSALIKDNYVLTLRRLEQDQAFMDTSIAYYQKFNRLPDNINEYVNSGNEIINRLRTSNTQCAQNDAEEINRAIEEFTDKVQVGKESFWSKLSSTIFSVWGLVILGGVVVVALAFFMGKRSSVAKK